MKLKPSKSLKSAEARALRYFAKFIRLRDRDKRCITCGSTSKKDCGHFISVRFKATKFDEKNANGQCEKCNRFEYGNQYEHGQQIDKLHGEGTAERLLMISKITCKRSRFDFDYIAQYFKDKISMEIPDTVF